jgi:2-polyprenyl-6-methoxyphenol hydroxylase-like FAD-dependent oxidoreductase
MPKALIIGGSVGGLLAANLLARADADIRQARRRKSRCGGRDGPRHRFGSLRGQQMG